MTGVATRPWKGERIWFDDRDRAAFDGLPSIRLENCEAYQVRFVGKAMVPLPPGQRCGFGQWGMSSDEVIATRVLSIEALGNLR